MKNWLSYFVHNLICKAAKETQMYRTDFWTLWGKAMVGCLERTASKHVYYLGWKRSPAQVGCMRQVLGPGALGRPRGIGWGGRREGGSGWGTHVNPWLIHVNVWQKPLQYCKVISLQLIKINGKKMCKIRFAILDHIKSPVPVSPDFIADCCGIGAICSRFSWWKCPGFMQYFTVL